MEEKKIADIFEEMVYSQGWSILDKNVDEIVKLMHSAYELGINSQPPIPNGEKTIQGEESGWVEAESIIEQLYPASLPFNKVFSRNNVVVLMQEYATLKTTSLEDKIAEKDEEIAKLTNALERISCMGADSGRKGCTYGDTEYDSQSAAFGYNLCLSHVQPIVNEALTNKP